MDNRQQEQEEQQQWLVYQKLQQARVNLQNVELKKSGHNNFAGFKYFELADFLPTVNNIFYELGLCSVFSIEHGEAVMRIIDTEFGGTIFFRSPVADAVSRVTIDAGKSPPIQALGSQHTYLRRYLFLNALEITEHDAVDASIGKDEPKSSKPITKSVFDDLDAESQDEIRSYAADIILMIHKDQVADAVEYINSLGLDADWKTALWSLLDSKQRSAIKKFTKG
jgi:hypothetical protein